MKKMLDKQYFKWQTFDRKRLRYKSQSDLFMLAAMNTCFINQERKRGKMSEAAIQSYERSLDEIKEEMNRRRVLREIKQNALKEWEHKIEEERMAEAEKLGLVPPVIKSEEKADKKKEKPVTAIRQSKPRTSEEVIKKIQEMRTDPSKSISEIARVLNVSFETVKKYEGKVASKPSQAKKPTKTDKKDTKNVVTLSKKVSAVKDSNKSKITMLVSEIRGKLQILESLVRKEIEAAK